MSQSPACERLRFSGPTDSAAVVFAACTWDILEGFLAGDLQIDQLQQDVLLLKDEIRIKDGVHPRIAGRKHQRMSVANTKKLAIATIRRLPDDATVAHIMAELYFCCEPCRA